MPGLWMKTRSYGSMMTMTTMKERLSRKAESRTTSLTVTGNTWKPRKVGTTSIYEYTECVIGAAHLLSRLRVLAGAANGAGNNVKAAALPTAAAVTPNSSSASSVKTVSLPATPVMKVRRCYTHNCWLMIIHHGPNCHCWSTYTWLNWWTILIKTCCLDYGVTQDICIPSQTTLVGLVDYPDDEDEEDDDEEEQSPRKRPRLTS